MTNMRISLLTLAALMLAVVTATAQQLATAKVVAVSGTVTKYAADGSKSPLAVGDLLREGDAVTSAALSSADLIFSNGSELTIEENTSVDVATLEQEPFSGGQTYAQLQADPSPSQTVLELNYGQLSGHVKKLRSDSRFDIDTPMGTAAIRGTTFTVEVGFDQSTSQFFVNITNSDGIVVVSTNLGETITYGADGTAEADFDPEAATETVENVPAGSTVRIRLPASDGNAPEIFEVLLNDNPEVQEAVQPVVTPGPTPGDDNDPTDEDDDFGTIVVSPEGPVSPATIPDA